MEAVVTTSLGTFRFEFFPDKAPKHVEQFIRLARQGYYDGSAFHRAVLNGVIQGGDPLLKDAKTPRNLWGTGGLNMLAGEISDLKHERGVVSTIRVPDKPNSDGAQFFVCVVAQPSPGRPVFGVWTRERGHGGRREDFPTGARRGWHAELAGANSEGRDRAEEAGAFSLRDAG